MLAEELKKLAELRDAGVLTEAEFQRKKGEMLNMGAGAGSLSTTQDGGDLDERYGSIYCSSDQKIILGLCGGLAHKFGLPPAAMRLIVFVSLWFLVGWLYLIGIFLPKLPTKNVRRVS